MQPKLKNAFKLEMLEAKAFYLSKNYEKSFYHLERAHILGQRNYIPHVLNHWWMLKVGWKIRDFGEVFGQILRILGSAGSLVGVVPIGNTGGADVSATKPMPIPDDLVQYFKE